MQLQAICSREFRLGLQQFLKDWIFDLFSGEAYSTLLSHASQM